MVKTITIKDSVYEELIKIKGDKSFSELLEELIKKRSNLKMFKGIFKDSKVLDEIEKEILEERKKIKSRI